MCVRLRYILSDNNFHHHSPPLNLIMLAALISRGRNLILFFFCTLLLLEHQRELALCVWLYASLHRTKWESPNLNEINFNKLLLWRHRQWTDFFLFISLSFHFVLLRSALLYVVCEQRRANGLFFASKSSKWSMKVGLCTQRHAEWMWEKKILPRTLSVTFLVVGAEDCLLCAFLLDRRRRLVKTKEEKSSEKKKKASCWESDDGELTEIWSALVRQNREEKRKHTARDRQAARREAEKGENCVTSRKFSSA